MLNYTFKLDAGVVQEMMKQTKITNPEEALRKVLKCGLTIMTIVNKEGCSVHIHNDDEVRKLVL